MKIKSLITLILITLMSINFFSCDGNNEEHQIKIANVEIDDQGKLSFEYEGILYRILDKQDGNLSYQKCELSKRLNRDIKNIIIPDTFISGTTKFVVTRIRDNAFFECKSLRTIYIPNSVTDIGIDAFGYSGIEKIRLPDNLKEIRERTFRNCYYLRDITLPNSLVKIGDYAFSSCGLNSIIIPNSVTQIGTRAFACGRCLKKVTLPNNFAGDLSEIFGEKYYEHINFTNIKTFNNENQIATSPESGPSWIEGTWVYRGYDAGLGGNVDVCFIINRSNRQISTVDNIIGHKSGTYRVYNNEIHTSFGDILYLDDSNRRIGLGGDLYLRKK